MRFEKKSEIFQIIRACEISINLFYDGTYGLRENDEQMEENGINKT